MDRVPCPHCGQKNDLRELQATQCFDTGNEIECDHCHRMMQVASIATLTVVAVRALNKSAPARDPDAAPARTIGGRFLNKLLR